VLVGAFRSPASEIADLHEPLVGAAASAGMGGTIELSDIVTSDWDRAYVFNIIRNLLDRSSTM